MVMTQNEKVMKYLGQGKTLTVRQARSRFNIKNLSARIAELREDGAKIKSTVLTSGNGRSVAYSLARR